MYSDDAFEFALKLSLSSDKSRHKALGVPIAEVPRMARGEIPETGVRGQAKSHLREEFMVQTGRNRRQPAFDDLGESRNLAPCAHIAARFAHPAFRMRDGMSHKCPLEDSASLRQLAATDPLVVQTVVLASADIALWMFVRMPTEVGNTLSFVAC